MSERGINDWTVREYQEQTDAVVAVKSLAPAHFILVWMAFLYANMIDMDMLRDKTMRVAPKRILS